MDTRQPLQLSLEPAVLSISFNELSTRFICGLDNGVRAFRSNDCIRTLKEAPEPGKGIAVASSLDDRHLAIVGGGRSPNGSPNKLEFWDNLLAKKVTELDFAEQILSIRMTCRIFAVVLRERTICFRYAALAGGETQAPAKVLGLYDTAANLHALCCIRADIMALPGITPGQVQIVWLNDKTKKLIRAHSSELRQMDLSKDGHVLATASKQGTLIRVFSTSTLSQTHEFRRGVDSAIIYSLSISPSNQLVASTSDKGTLHIYDLRSSSTEETPKLHLPRKRSSLSRNTASARPRQGSIDFDTHSIPSASSSPRTAGFYGPPTDLAHAPPVHAPSPFAALAKFPGMPRAFSDVRSITSISYHTGADPPNWQGQPAYTTTTLPNGQKGRVKNPNVPVPGWPDGRPPKGVLAWDPEGGDRRIWCVGGGADARWERFELIELGQTEDGGTRLKIVNAGFRRYLTRQFPEKEDI